MTRIPFVERHEVGGAIGPAYAVPNECSHPFCQESLVERHHLCRRSFLGGPYDWVDYRGVLLQNVVGLCSEHHRQITENKGAIVWNPLGFFEWVDASQTGGPYQAGRLSPHPGVGGGQVPHTDLEETHPDICPTCKRPKRRKTPHEHKRPRERWTIHVPKDERENGADVLDTLLEEARRSMAQAGLAYGDEDNARYFVLSAVLGLFVQHAREVMNDGVGDDGVR